MKNDKSDFTQGSILQKLAFFMLPILGALVLQAAYGAVDLLVVGRFGSTSGLSAVSTGSQVLNLVTFVITQFAMGITVLIARYLGEKKEQSIGQVIGGGTVVFALISAVLFSMVGYFNGNNQTLWVMIQGLVQTLLVRLPMAYCMSMQPNASLTKIGLSAPTSTLVGIVLNVGYYLYWSHKNKEAAPAAPASTS